MAVLALVAGLAACLPVQHHRPASAAVVHVVAHVVELANKSYSEVKSDTSLLHVKRRQVHMSHWQSMRVQPLAIYCTI